MAGILEVVRNRGDELLVERVQVGVGGIQQLVLEEFDVVRAEAEFSKLEAQELEDAAQSRSRAGGHDLEAVPREQAGMERVADAVILHQQRRSEERRVGKEGRAR